jgi:hypothetical protein
MPTAEKIKTPLCLSYHPQNPLPQEEVATSAIVLSLRVLFCAGAKFCASSMTSNPVISRPEGVGFFFDPGEQEPIKVSVQKASDSSWAQIQ